MNLIILIKNAKYLFLDLHAGRLTSMLTGPDPYSEFRSNYPITSLNYIQPDSDPDSQDWEKGRSLQSHRSGSKSDQHVLLISGTFMLKYRKKLYDTVDNELFLFFHSFFWLALL